MECGTAPLKWRFRLRRLLRWAGALLLFLLLIIFLWMSGAIYRHFVTFPRQEAAWAALQSERQPVQSLHEWREYRGILHSHSELSHDCEVPFVEILRVLKSADLDFICLSDHCDQGRADFNVQWRGFHDGKLFIPGFEMKEGIMPFGVASGVVLSNRTESSLLARQIITNGGVLFYAHPEGDRAWDCPELTGMEIYNIHSDVKNLRHGLVTLLPDLLLNQKRYPDSVFRLIFRRPASFLQRWDELNQSRHITGIAGNDCHQNTGIRGIYVTGDILRIEDTSPKTLVEHRLNFLTRPLARLCFGLLATNEPLFRLQLDPYERMARFVNTHLLARELNEPSVLEALRVGRVFIGFDRLADSTGFLWYAQAPNGLALMGESLSFSPEILLKAASPLPGRFTILKDGIMVHQAEGRTLQWKPSRPGKYRLEVELKILNKWEPWIYANPIDLR